jgi:hypothetical protein
MRIAIAALVLFVTARVSAAEPAKDVGRKSRVAAVTLAVGTTALGVTMMAVAGTQGLVPTLGLGGGLIAVVGPASGHIYAGEYRHALVTSLVRGAFAIAYARGLQQGSIGGLDSHRDHSTTWATAAGGIVLLGATVYDFIDAPRAVRRANKRSALQLAPAVTRDAAAVTLSGLW